MATTTSFFKIILSTEPRLRLPHNIVNKYKESMPTVVSVDGPYGPAFQVELTPSHGEIWLEKGFQQFMDYYSIKPGYLLVFKCDLQASFFHVTIFNQSATEIDYPLTSFKSCWPKESGEILRKRKNFQGRKLEGGDDDDVSIETLEENNDYEVSDHLMNDISRNRETEKLEETTQALKPDKLTAHERAKSFISSRPSLLRFMHRSYIDGTLSISKWFVRELIKKKNVCDIVLRVPGGTRTWTAKCSAGSGSAKLRWKSFVKDNELREGDACVFELGNNIIPSLNVIIFRSYEDEEVKGNLGNINLVDDDDSSIEILEKIPILEDISRKPKTCKRKKLEEVEDESVEAKETTKKEMKKALENKEYAAEVTKEAVPQKCTPCKKAPAKRSSSNAQEDKDKGTNALAKKKTKKSSSAEASSSGKKPVKGKETPKGETSLPNADELRDAICDILKEVDINTATLSDILKQLSKLFDTDLAPRKLYIKLMIQEELLKLADEADQAEDDDDDSEDNGA